MDKNYLTSEEKEILEHFENDVRNAAKDIKDEKNIAISAADNFMKKSERINIRLNSYDLNHIKK